MYNKCVRVFKIGAPIFANTFFIDVYAMDNICWTNEKVSSSGHYHQNI